ncbi:hypothetical protein LCGC14_1877160, partial [marine sediment metagenome]
RRGFFGLDVRTGKLRWRKNANDTLVRNMNSARFGAGELIVLGHPSGAGTLTSLDPATGKTTWTHQLSRTQSPWRSAPQIRGGMVLVVHGRTDWAASLYDLASKKLLGTIPLGRGKGQAHVTGDGLVVVSDGKSIRLIEPMLGVDQPIWTVRLVESLQPTILGATDTHVIVSPSNSSPLVELRSLAHHGGITRSFHTRAMSGRPAIPARARIVGDRLYVVAAQLPASGRGQLFNGRLAYLRGPSLHAFDLTTGKELWATRLTVAGAATHAELHGHDHQCPHGANCAEGNGLAGGHGRRPRRLCPSPLAFQPGDNRRPRGS